MSWRLFAPWLTPWLVAAGLIAAPSAHALLCSIDSVSPVVFGAYDGLTRNTVDATGSVTFGCFLIGLFDNITIDISRGASATFSPRTLKAGTKTLQYNLFLDAARTSIWGDTTSGTSHFGPFHPPLLGTTSRTIYGRVFSGQNVGAGSYSDTLVITLNY